LVLLFDSQVDGIFLFHAAYLTRWAPTPKSKLGELLDGGKTLASGGGDTIILWDVDPQSWIEKTCGRVGRNFTQAEWSKYFPDDAYRKTCVQWPVPPSVISAILKEAAAQAEAGQLPEALKHFDYAQSLRPDPTAPFTFDDAESLNNLCWAGGLYGYATPQVLFICDQAVAAAPTNGNVRDSRGLVRALSGNTDGAIEDFQAFVELAKASGSDVYAEQITQREQWIAELQAGRNPFTPEVLEALKDQ